MNRNRAIFVCLAIVLGPVSRSPAVMFLDTGDIAHNTSTPGDNSGWQYEGKFNTELGVPIAPYFFIGAEHLGANAVGHVFLFHGDSYTTIAKHDIPFSDLRIWEVDHSKPFRTFAPLSSGSSDIGVTATLIGRGTRRGAEFFLGLVSKGWANGTVDNVQRWGRNIVEGVFSDPDYGEILYCEFNKPGVPEECHMSTGDSGGGLFVLEDGLWRLAGINLAVDGPFRAPPAGPRTYGAMFDTGGLEFESPSNVWNPIMDEPEDKPSWLYSSRISALTAEILAITGEDGSLADENFSAWQTLYFTPAEIANPAVTGPLADFDRDGIANVLEFALNLEPGFNARSVMTPVTGLSGLPLVRLENISGDDHLTMEFVRRTVASGAGLTYLPQFASDLDNWLVVGTETVTPINPRWERVKVVDPHISTGNDKRFGRLKVTLAE